jgi:hypothetical protein
MNMIEHIVSPQRLLLVWRTDRPGASRTRRVVAEVVRPSLEDPAVLRYLHGSEDFESAKSEGFHGYPSFDMKQNEHSSNVLDSFIRRLPPRKRDDFDAYLEQHRLLSHSEISDMALLAYTNAKLPGDGFELYPDLSDARPPFEIIIEVAGFRHQYGVVIEDIYNGDPVTLKAEPDNLYDPNAIAVYHNGKNVGYIARAQAVSFHSWFKKGYKVNAVVERINGKVDRPLVYLFITVR